MQGSYGGTIFVQIDFSASQACSAELRVSTMQQADVTCSLTSTADTLPYKGSVTNKVMGGVSPLHFKGEGGCSAYKQAVNGITDKAVVTCNN